ncbi:MAG: efflux RND transporter periplasmic adaptor subunit [Candidatus Paceibacterota bacterium]
MLEKTTRFISAHKIISIVLIIALISLGLFAYNIFTPKAASKYVVAAAAKGTLISSISGTGQVSTSNEVAISAKVSGDITYIGVVAGQEVNDGKLLLQIDSSDAEQAVRDAQANYDLAQLSLEELKAPADELTVLQAESSLINAQQSKEDAEYDLKKAYTDGFTSISNAFLDLPAIATGLNNLLFGNSFNNYQTNLDYYTGAGFKYDSKIQQYRDDAYSKYQKAKAAYDQNFSDYKNSTRSMSSDEIESLINETYETTLLLSDAVKSSSDLIQFYKDQLTDESVSPNSLADTHLATLNGYMSKTNSSLSSLLAIQQTISNDKKTTVSAERSIVEKQISLDKIKAGATDINIKSQELAVAQKYNALLAAKKNLSDYYITAPFSGTIAKLSVSRGESVSSGAALVTFISDGKIVNVSLNEVDISKVKLGDAVTLTFDALPDLSLTGKVTQVDTIGTVTSGVVNYNVEISFTDDTGTVKPGMSASVNIITEAKTDVLMVPNSAIKSLNNSYYVQSPSVAVDSAQLDNSKGISLKGALTTKTVEIGSANDSYTEITSGLNENDQVITGTINASAKASMSSTKSTTSTTIKSTTGNMMIQGLGGPPN